MMKQNVYRLKKNKEFRKVYSLGRSFADRRIIIYLHKNAKEESRFGFTVSKKVGNAVIRNKVRRKLKEICRLNRSKIKKGFDVIVIARPAAAGEKYLDFEKSFIWLIKKSGLLTKEDK